MRHSLPLLTSEQPPSQWSLSVAGRTGAAEAGRLVAAALGAVPARIIASGEVKAVETATLLELGPVDVDDRLGEVAKPWYQSADDHRNAAVEYLSGHQLPSWEPQADALARFGAAVESAANDCAVIVTHGTVWALWLSDRLSNFDPVAFWLGLEMPDIHEVDMDAGTITRLAG